MLSFGSASMLWWGLAAVIPLALHLWNRRPRQVVPFAATRFILAATHRQSRRIKFQQWVLLALRIVMLLLFALALAEPRWQTSSPVMYSGSSTHHLLMIDDSYSMEAKVDSERRLDLAKIRLKEIVQNSAVGDVFSLIAMADPAEILIAGPSHERAEIEQVIDAIHTRQADARIAPALSLVRRLIDEGKSLSPASRFHHVTIASDLARNSWGEVNPEQIDVDLASAASGCTWSLIALGDVPPRSNLAITDFSRRSDIGYTRDALTGEVSIANTGATSAEHVMLEIQAGDQVFFREELALAAGQQRTFDWTIDGSNQPLLLTARLDADDLPVDDRRYLVIESRRAPRVLCLASSAEAATHVELALSSGPVDRRPKIEVRVIRATEEQPLGELNEYNAIVLLNLPSPQGEFAAALRSYVEKGGGLLIGLGDLAARQDCALYPASPGPLVALQAPRIDPLAYAHPLMAAFRDAPEVGLLTPPIWRYQRLEKIHTGAKVAAKFGNGDAALVEEALGSGKIVLFAGSLGAESVDAAESPPAPWSGLPGSAAYLPIIREWVNYCAAPKLTASHHVGDSLEDALHKNYNEAEFSVTGVDWANLPAVRDAFPTAGFYRAAGRSPVAVNINVDESWFASERDRFSRWINSHREEAPLAVLRSPRASEALAVWLLFPLGLLICGELMLATWLRRSKSSATMRSSSA